MHVEDVEVIDVDVDMYSNIDVDVREGPSWDTREHREHRKKGQSGRKRKEVVDVDLDLDGGHSKQSRSHSRHGEHRGNGKGTQRAWSCEKDRNGKRAVDVETIDVDMDVHDGDDSLRECQAQRWEIRRSRSRSLVHETGTIAGRANSACMLRGGRGDKTRVRRGPGMGGRRDRSVCAMPR